MQKPGGQLFTPGVASDSAPKQLQPHPQMQPSWVGAGGEYGQPHQGAPMTQLEQQFGQMDLQGGQRPVGSPKETSQTIPELLHIILGYEYAYEPNWNAHEP